MPKKLSTNNVDSMINQISDNIINGNKTDALEQIKTLSPLHAGDDTIIVYEADARTVTDKRWLMNG